jgi:lysozyme
LLNLVDISHYQNVTDLSSVKQDGLAGIFCKATDGPDFVDPTFGYRMMNIPKLGLVPGGYHFSRPLQNPVQQAQRFCQTLAAWSPLLVAIDLEESYQLSELSDDWSHYSVDYNCNWVTKFLTEFKSHFTGNPFIYGTKEFINRALAGLDLSMYPLWVADYGENLVSPRLPSCYINAGKSFTIWQTSPGGTEAGITGNTDLDIFNGDLTLLKALVCTAIS